MVTFADLMTLLLTFFVLMLSFAEIDAIRFKRLAGELQKAFGVQREIPADVVPMGTSPVLQQFSPGTPQPIPVDEIYQRLTSERTTLAAGEIDSRVRSRLEAIEQQLEQTIREAAPEGNVAVERDGLDIIVRINEKGSFPSGSAEISTSFRQLLDVLSTELIEIPGYIAVDGHTDNVPIRSARFQSNWDLSAMRAATVTNELIENPALEPGRFIVIGHADTRPLVPNNTPEQRAQNRRVELIIRAGEMVERELGLRTSIEDPVDQAVAQAASERIETDEEPVDLDVLFEQGLDAIEPTNLEAFFAPQLEAEPEPQLEPDAIESDEAPIENEEPGVKPGEEPFDLRSYLGLDQRDAE